MNTKEIESHFENESKDLNKYIESVLAKYAEQGVVPAQGVREAAKITYIIAMINKLKGEKNVKRTSRKKAVAISSK